ncbi:hypothetical protein BV25DRAFT_1990040 [Artomyces pyxidatus]|uniref:Uncharacterized protein n=1 Tax=Artomyces pyxidatus TaxID=48021 RepID=A0ACB8T6B3_9AGAM|nr:hypothetical protein BV25DRAFT_1990040 [Artomyces pyxidatus]
MDKSLDEIVSASRTKGPRRGAGRRNTGGRATILGTSGPGPAAKARVAANLAANGPKATSAAQPADKIIVSNLPADVNEAQVKDLFATTVGPLREVNLHYDSAGRSKGVASVSFQKRGDGTKAYQQYNNRLIDGISFAGFLRMHIDSLRASRRLVASTWPSVSLWAALGLANRNPCGALPSTLGLWATPSLFATPFAMRADEHVASSMSRLSFNLPTPYGQLTGLINLMFCNLAWFRDEGYLADSGLREVAESWSTLDVLAFIRCRCKEVPVEEVWTSVYQGLGPKLRTDGPARFRLPSFRLPSNPLNARLTNLTLLLPAAIVVEFRSALPPAERPMKIEVVVDPSRLAPAPTLASRVAPATNGAAAADGTQPARRGVGGARGRGGRRGGRKGGERPAKSVADLDAEMEDYTASNGPAAPATAAA